MIATSDELEALSDRVREIANGLAKLKGKQVVRAETLSALSSVAKDWLRLSPGLRSEAGAFLPSLDPYDQAMTDVLASTKVRSRESAYRAKLKLFQDEFVDRIVVPLIRFEGSPSQVAARQLEDVFVGTVNPDELAYIQEAARCSGIHGHRAAIVLLWAAAMARLHTAIQNVGFAAFNQAADTSVAKKGQPYARVSRGLTVQSLAELQRARDFDIIVVGMELWKYDLQVFEELDRLLGTRNSAAHPGMFQPGALDVRQFAEKLKKYVFTIVK